MTGVDNQGTTRQTTEPAPPPDVGIVVGQRYTLVRRLGAGGHGEVWEATDALGGEPVAIKIITREGVQAARVRREIAALRLLRLPGVVRLFDEGMHRGKPFLVMERIEGRPFPAIDLPATWDEISDVALGLFETLGRIHGAGIVHRDLKPANVLVDQAGRPIVLDFGLSAGRPLGATVTEEGVVVGTPAYLAPEQLFGEDIGPWTDLYSTGLLLYEALSGRLPHGTAGDSRAWMRVRLTQRPRPLSEVAPIVPARVAAVVDALLALEPARRPRSAEEVVALLRGDARRARPLARFGSPSLEDLEAHARSGASIAVVGPAGSGRTRCLDEIAEAVTREGARTARATPGERPFESLEPVVGSPPAEATALADVEAFVQRRLGELRAEGGVLLADDAERMDRWSAGAVARARTDGLRVLCAGAEETAAGVARIDLGPHPEEALRAVFVGPDRIFHLAEDGARALFERTAGLASRVAEELGAWERARLARFVEGRVVVDRDALERIASSLHGGWAPLGAHSPGDGQKLSPRAADQLAWLRLAWPHTTSELLAEAQGEPRWRLEAELADLVEAGLAWRLDDGRLQPLAGAGATAAWTADRLAAAHLTLARLLPVGAEGRLFHLVAGQDETSSVDAAGIADEACAFARRVAEAGQLGRATAALSEASLALTRPEDPEAEAARLRVLTLWVEIALVDATPTTLDRVLYEICRTELREGLLADLERLVRAGLEDAWKGEGVSKYLSGLAAFEEPGLEHRRQLLRVRAARRRSIDEEEALLRELEPWGRTGSEAAGALLNWRGSHCYHQGRFVEAAALHDEAARTTAWATARLSARLNGASALLEAFRLDEAASWAQEARNTAAACRLPFFEARAEWILRSALYRAGAVQEPDEDLLAAVERLGVADLDALVSMTEAAVAWRSARVESARELAKRAARRFADAANASEVVAEALAQVSSPTPAIWDDLVQRAWRIGSPSLRLQALGLLARAGAKIGDAGRAADGLESEVPRESWGLRMDILSVDEALTWLGV